MKVIGMYLGVTQNPNNKLGNTDYFLESNRKLLGLKSMSESTRQENRKFIEVLKMFIDDESYLATYLLINGYKFIHKFKTEKSFKDYIKKERIKGKIGNGKFLIGNIYYNNDILHGNMSNYKKSMKCTGIVIAEKSQKVNEKVDTILENN